MGNWMTDEEKQFYRKRAKLWVRQKDRGLSTRETAKLDGTVSHTTVAGVLNKVLNAKKNSLYYNL